jgi:hypothetical protein
LSNNYLFLPSLWAKELVEKLNQNLVLANLLNSTAYWADNVPVDEGDFDAYSFQCQACVLT